MGTKLTAARVKEMLAEKGVHPDTVSVKNGIYTIRFGYFFTSGRTSQHFADRVTQAGFEVIEHDNHWTSFRGGASVAQQSHFMVKFKVKE